MKVKMSIHRALSELKAYEDRINRNMKATYVIANKNSNDKIDGYTIEEVKNKIKGNFDSVNALIDNRQKIKDAVTMSNAITKVLIAGEELTIAEAIERKNSIKFKEKLLMELKGQYANQSKKVEIENEKLPEKLESYLTAILGEKDKRTVEDIKRYTDDFNKMHKYDLINPCNISGYIEKLEKEIIDFKTNVDYVLSESNAVTFVEVDLVG